MKQTSNTLKLLNNHYRAIFKRALVLGLCSCIGVGVLTTTASAAQGSQQALATKAAKKDKKQHEEVPPFDPATRLAATPIQHKLKEWNNAAYNAMDGYGVEFLKAEYATQEDLGLGADKIAHFANYAGTTIVVNESINTVNDTIASRFGIGSGLLQQVDATQGHANAWLVPNFKYIKTKNFKAEGVQYGADFKSMIGLSLGGDYTLNNGITVGLMANLGMGKTDGVENAAGVKNDFKTMNLAAYAGIKLGQADVVADIHGGKFNNKITGKTIVKDYTDIEADAPSKAFGLGIAAQYNLATPYADIKPHVGLRYARVMADKYDVKTAKGTIATIDTKDQNIITIPVGISVSKNITEGEWTISPIFDLSLNAHLTGNSSENTVNFNGTKIPFDLKTDVMDKVGFGTTLGVNVNKGKLDFGVNVGYQGSSNYKEFGANANVSMAF